ncbi:hypothetical protein HG530_013780 [Fusarium avenaceum]|nr:hypothetical protein HG530_013780 [Fusarium avenaceum]
MIFSRLPRSLRAGKREDLVAVLVADECAETALVGWLPALTVAELGATGELAAFVGAVVPLLEDLVDLLLVLHDHEAGVEEQVAPTVAVVLGVGVVGEGHGVVLGVDAPVVHKPLHGEIQLVEEGVGVDEDTDIMLLKDLG